MPLANRGWVGMAISDSGVLWMAETGRYTVYQITDSGATQILSQRAFPDSANTSTGGLATDGTYVYAYDNADTGYYRNPITDAATGELGAGTFTDLPDFGNEQGISLQLFRRNAD